MRESISNEDVGVTKAIKISQCMTLRLRVITCCKSDRVYVQESHIISDNIYLIRTCCDGIKHNIQDLGFND